MDDISQITMLEMYNEGRITLREICERFQVHRTTVWRQLRTLKQQGREGLVHKLKGRPSNRSKPQSVRSAVLELFQSFAQNQPRKVFQFYQQAIQGSALNVSYTTVRRWLKAATQLEQSK